VDLDRLRQTLTRQQEHIFSALLRANGRTLSHDFLVQAMYPPRHAERGLSVFRRSAPRGRTQRSLGSAPLSARLKRTLLLTVLSLGAGVQSTTLALMAAHGEIDPAPECGGLCGV
jgi:hypothetical protein